MFSIGGDHRKRQARRREGSPADQKKRSSSERHSGSSRRDSVSRGYDGRGLARVKEEEQAVLVGQESLQITFENLKAVIASCDDDVFSADSVSDMLDSVYQWMVFDKDSQLVVPSAPGSAKVQKMWPHGSIIDTRKKSDDDSKRRDSRSLKDVSKDYASTVASSVVSSNRGDEDMQASRKNTVVYQQPSVDFGGQTFSPPYSPRYEAYGQVHAAPLYAGYEDPAPPSQPIFVSRDSHAHKPMATRQKPRYSIITSPVSPPARVLETPMSGQEPQQHRQKRKVNVGASARQKHDEEAGEDVMWAE